MFCLGPISSEPTEEQLLASATASTSSGNSLGPFLAGFVEITLGKDEGAGKGKKSVLEINTIYLYHLLIY